jgi:hypothetical protein
MPSTQCFYFLLSDYSAPLGIHKYSSYFHRLRSNLLLGCSKFSQIFLPFQIQLFQTGPRFELVPPPKYLKDETGPPLLDINYLATFGFRVMISLPHDSNTSPSVKWKMSTTVNCWDMGSKCSSLAIIFASSERKSHISCKVLLL